MTSETTRRFNLAKQLFALGKNGVVSDHLKAGGLPHRIIWGLNLPQLRRIAEQLGEPSEELARALMADTATRESLLLAPLMMPPEAVPTIEAAEALVEQAPTTEVVDVLCHALLRRLPFAPALAERLAPSERPLTRLGAMRLLAARWRECPAQARALAEAEAGRRDPVTLLAARNLLDDIDFFTS